MSSAVGDEHPVEPVPLVAADQHEQDDVHRGRLAEVAGREAEPQVERVVEGLVPFEQVLEPQRPPGREGVGEQDDGERRHGAPRERDDAGDGDADRDHDLGPAQSTDEADEGVDLPLLDPFVEAEHGLVEPRKVVPPQRHEAGEGQEQRGRSDQDQHQSSCGEREGVDSAALPLRRPALGRRAACPRRRPRWRRPPCASSRRSGSPRPWSRCAAAHRHLLDGPRGQRRGLAAAGRRARRASSIRSSWGTTQPASPISLARSASMRSPVSSSSIAYCQPMRVGQPDRADDRRARRGAPRGSRTRPARWRCTKSHHVTRVSP